MPNLHKIIILVLAIPGAIGVAWTKVLNAFCYVALFTIPPYLLGKLLAHLIGV